ncbi:hypothetical protein [Phenylobacterium sp.]|jgi:hypothetical protein|uniref:hypothetical protein n=1 Tax=Phenylobacterium sp. TaxID=1871053 RepID=UPI002E3524A5|nr:hypothetical protein [Phenylobacterium sp.]HEX2559902.1 hypothetical protein [Phenylobacterium sp.]
MKHLPLVAALALIAGAAQAQSPMNQNPPTQTTLCLEVNGSIIPPVCHRPASRVDQREDICLCSNGGIRVDAPVCAPGERPPAESRVFENARRDAGRDGTLMGDMWQGQRMCVDIRRGR